MKDPDDDGTIDFVEELNFNDKFDESIEDEETSLCPCCRLHEISSDQERCQIEGEICTICNFYEWEEV